MPKFVAVIDGTGQQPPDNWGCNCRKCAERWKRREAFQQKVVVFLCNERKDIPAHDIWQHSIEITNAIESMGIPYEAVDLKECVFHTEKEIQENPELIRGAPPGATLQ